MYKKLQSFIQSQMSFTSREANGFVVVIFLILVCVFAPIVVNWYLPTATYNASKDQAMLDSLMHQLEAIPSSKKTYTTKFNTSKVVNISSFPFDPNVATEADLLKLGLPQKVVSNVVKFRNKGGKFITKKDFAKIYGLEPLVFAKLVNHILLPDSLVRHNTFKKSFENRIHATKTLDINTADTTALIALRGIGSKLATRIVKYRDGLGGIVNTIQYKEIYGLDSTTLKVLEKQTFIADNFVPQKIRLKNCTIAQLQNHPYLNKKEAQVLFNYLQQHPMIASPTEISEIKIISKEKLEKLLPYLE